MKRLKSIVLAVVAVVVAASFALPSSSAQAASSSALSIPPKKNYLISPGDSVNDKLVIRNLDTASALNLTLRVIDFTYTDNGGTPKLFLDPNAPQTTWSLKPFMKVPKSVSIAPGQSASLDMSISIPEGHGAGSYYSAIIYSSGPADNIPGGNVGLNASGVTLAFVNIPGKVNENLKLKDFGAYDDTAGYQFFMMTMPQKIGFSLQNNGNVVESPVGSIILTDLFGNKRQIDNLNPTGSLALIGQTRTFTPCIKIQSQNINFNGTKTEATQCTDPGLWPGIYTASIDLYYGQNGNNTQEVTKTTVFWYFPLWFIVLVIVVLGLLIFFGWRGYNKIRTKLYGPKRSTRRR